MAFSGTTTPAGLVHSAGSAKHSTVGSRKLVVMRTRPPAVGSGGEGSSCAVTSIHGGAPTSDHCPGVGVAAGVGLPKTEAGVAVGVVICRSLPCVVLISPRATGQ